MGHVVHNHNVRVPSYHCVHVPFRIRATGKAVLAVPIGLKTQDEALDVLPPVIIDDADNNIPAQRRKLMGFLEHGESLTHTRRRAQKNAKSTSCHTHSLALSNAAGVGRRNPRVKKPGCSGGGPYPPSGRQPSASTSTGLPAGLWKESKYSL